MVVFPRTWLGLKCAPLKSRLRCAHSMASPTLDNWNRQKPLCLSASRRLLSLFCALRRKIAGSHLFLFLFFISLHFLLTLKIRILLFPLWNAHVSNLNKEQDSTYSKTLPFFALTEDYKEACAVLLSNISRTLLQPLTSPKKRKVSREIHKRSRLPHLCCHSFFDLFFDWFICFVSLFAFFFALFFILIVPPALSSCPAPLSVLPPASSICVKCAPLKSRLRCAHSMASPTLDTCKRQKHRSMLIKTD